MKTSSSGTASELGYPAEVVERALAARDEALRLAQARVFPFDYETQISALQRCPPPGRRAGEGFSVVGGFDRNPGACPPRNGSERGDL